MLPIIITSNNHICSFVKGCTVFKQCWRISIGEYLIIKMEPSNSVNIYTVSVNKDVKEFSWMLSASDFHWIFCSFRLSLNSRFVINFPRFFKPLFRPTKILLLRYSQNNYQMWLYKLSLICEELSYQFSNTSGFNQAVFGYY